MRDGSRVPTAPIQRLVREYVARQQRLTDLHQRDIIDNLAERASYPALQFRKHVFFGENKTLDFWAVDRILTAMDNVQAWYCEPELEYFMRGVLGA